MKGFNCVTLACIIKIASSYLLSSEIPCFVNERKDVLSFKTHRRVIFLTLFGMDKNYLCSSTLHL
jgi:hypothetical protein